MLSPTTEFSTLSAHPALAAALLERGYHTPTNVQIAALGAPDADLLVSSQTGSGKTIAFGLLVARVLLGEAPKLTPAAAPRALVIAPTRELAVQVQRELAWLFAGTGARVVSFTGGTDLRLDAKALKRGVDIVVGTPGRLVDLVERGSLVLAALEVVVLDEADEMLDLGFREALELLLSRAPEERRTLLFSATLPPAIRSLAKRYQRDPVSLDPRKGQKGGAAAHDDIRHVAHVYAKGERIAVLTNVLRLADDDRAIVFCRTRSGVNELHRALVERGFLATAISGELAQSARTQALEGLRRGGVRVLVATNVAARGLDLPDVGLVVHADLPENSESLTHRSGRTGRAGKKGVSMFLVGLAERRKAERLFASAGLRLMFTTPPTASAVAVHDRDRLRREVSEAASAKLSEGALALATQLLAENEPQKLVAALLDRSLKDKPDGESVTPISSPPPGPAAKEYAPKGATSEAMVGFEINCGFKERAEAKWILPLVCRRGDVSAREVGAIRVERDRTYFEIAARVVAKFEANALAPDPRAPTQVIVRAKSGPAPRALHPAPRTPQSSSPRTSYPAAPSRSSSYPPAARAPASRGAPAHPASPRAPHYTVVPRGSAPAMAPRPSSPRPHSPRPPATRPTGPRPTATGPRPAGGHRAPVRKPPRG